MSDQTDRLESCRVSVECRFTLGVAAGSPGARSIGYGLWLLRLQPLKDGLQRLGVRTFAQNEGLRVWPYRASCRSADSVEQAPLSFSPHESSRYWQFRLCTVAL